MALRAILPAMSQPSAIAARVSRTALPEALFLGLLFVAVFFLPYLVTPSQTISRSYVAGFSNRAAIALLVVGAALFAFFTHGEPALSDTRDGRLSRRALGLGLLATLFACLAKCRIPLRIPGGEALYFLTRQQWMIAGRTLYHQLEFGYGPLLLYPSFWLQRLLHSSALMAYTLAWIAESVAGAAMLWLVVRRLDLPVFFRSRLFWFLLLSQLVWVDYGGVNYTCFRDFAAAFAITVTYALWKRTANPWCTALCAIASVIFCLACSGEQAVGAAIGLNLGLLLLVLARPRTFPVAALAASVAGTLVTFALASRWGMLLTFRSFETGGYAYPVLPSPSIILVLFAYVLAGCAFYRVLRLRELDSLVIPLTLGGVAMLPAALGRSDILHISGAGPLFLVGVAAIVSMPRIRRWWIPLSWVFLVLLPLALLRLDNLATAAGHIVPSARAPISNLSVFLARPENQTYISVAMVPPADLPCDRTYSSPSFMPVPLEPFRPACLETGYFDQFTNVATPQTIAQKLAELQQHSSQPLLMETTPLEDQLPLQLASMSSLRSESGSPWIPPERNPPLTYWPLIEYIQDHYTPGPLAAGGRLQIWNPRDSMSSRPLEIAKLPPI